MAHARVAVAGASSTRINEDLWENVGESCYMFRQHIRIIRYIAVQFRKGR